ncbi:hypothetical protein UFOVP782_3 [uncultured Caudovirales phage]|uniref:Uncharacterized protein n=1 Tax=uncultured Caudovirales phage TaxID=2100421 RepID=A0A6J5NQ46_9CAUD|nr:hypothetical protein UFOVP782_3 [uncultured Caudovirales phage]
MAKDVIVNLKINGVNQAITNFDQLETSIKDLETQLKQATYGSAQFEELSKNLKKARDQAEDFQVQTKGLNVQDKMAEVARAGAAIAGAFNLAQQAATAFGSDSKAAAEIAAKATAGLVVVQGIQAISESKIIMAIIAKTGAFISNTAAVVANRIANIGNTAAIVTETAATEGATIATNLFSAALKKNPIAFVIGLVLSLGAAVYGLAKAFDSSTKEIDLNAEAVKRLNIEIATQNKETERELAYMEAWGNDQEGIHKLKIKNFEEEAKKLREINTIYDNQRKAAREAAAEERKRLKEAAKEDKSTDYSQWYENRNETIRDLNKEEIEEFNKNADRIYKLELDAEIERIKLYKLQNQEKKVIDDGANKDYLMRLRNLHQEIVLLLTEDADLRAQQDLQHQRENAIAEIAQLKISSDKKAHLRMDLNTKYDLLEEQRAEAQRIRERDAIEKYEAELLTLHESNNIAALQDGEFMLASEVATFLKLDSARKKDLLDLDRNVRDKTLTVEQGEATRKEIILSYGYQTEAAIKEQRKAQLARAITAEQDETNAVVQEITIRGDKTLGTFQNTKDLILNAQLESLLQQKTLTEQAGEETVKIEEAIALKRQEIQKNSSDNLLAQINGSLQALQAASQSALAIIASQQEIGMNQIAADFAGQQEALNQQYGKANDDAIAQEAEARDIRNNKNIVGDKAVKAALDASAEKYAKRDYERKVAQSKQDRKRVQEENELRESQFGIQKAASIAAATISVIQGAINAYTSLSSIPVVGVGLGIAAAAAAVAAGAFQIAAIESTTFQAAALPDIYTDPSGLGGGSDSGGSGGSTMSGGRNYYPVRNGATGGLLVGPSHANGGIMSPFGELEGGEAVINKISTQRFGSILSSINQAGGGSPIPSTGREDAAPIFKTYVVASDVSSQQEADFKIRQIAKL